ncbi:SDR family NAD(P)-dependent oxidoreductase [Streptomyces sp. NPDC006235]|uniref:SDR family NAD(P)-dependent oxidoreductase n=1 Tax=Streptomyces sp. NPDC006235 TaxID=3156736 RepID=UPI0033B9B637
MSTGRQGSAPARSSRCERADTAMRHDGRTALVTGGARGIGLEIGRQLADRGLRVLVAARNPEAAGGGVPCHRPGGGAAGPGRDVRAERRRSGPASE